MTTANKVTILRVLLIPLFIMQVLYYMRTGNEIHRVAALLSFAIAAICDGIDGYIARRYNQRSELGAVLDPLADKLLLVSAVVLLSLDNRYLESIPLWLTTLIIGRDVILAIGLGIIYITCEKAKVRPNIIGKMATVFQMITVIWILLKWSSTWLNVWMIVGAVCTAISGLIYSWDGIAQISKSPTSAASPDQTSGDRK